MCRRTNWLHSPISEYGQNSRVTNFVLNTPCIRNQLSFSVYWRGWTFENCTLSRYVTSIHCSHSNAPTKELINCTVLQYPKDTESWTTGVVCSILKEAELIKHRLCSKTTVRDSKNNSEMWGNACEDLQTTSELTKLNIIGSSMDAVAAFEVNSVSKAAQTEHTRTSPITGKRENRSPRNWPTSADNPDDWQKNKW